MHKRRVAASPANSEHTKGLFRNNSLNPQKSNSFNSLNKKLNNRTCPIHLNTTSKAQPKPPNPLGTNKPNMNHQLIVGDIGD